MPFFFPFPFLGVSSKPRAWVRQSSVHRGQVGMLCVQQWASQTLHPGPPWSLEPQKQVLVWENSSSSWKGRCLWGRDRRVGTVVALLLLVWAALEWVSILLSLPLSKVPSVLAPEPSRAVHLVGFVQCLCGHAHPHFRLGEMLLGAGAWQAAPSPGLDPPCSM